MRCERESMWLTLIAVGFLALSTTSLARADIVYFENPPPGEEGHFAWQLQGTKKGDPVTSENWLDITRSSTDQSALDNGNSVAQRFDENGGDSMNYTFGGADVARLDMSARTLAFEFGEVFTEQPFHDFAAHWFMAGGPIQSEFPEGELRYMGVRTESGNYGWIAVIRDFWDLNAIGWAYETEPGVPLLAGEGSPPPPPVTAELVNFELVLGDLLAGDLDSLRDIDDDTLDINSNFGFNSSEPNLFILRVEAISPELTPPTLEISTTSRTNQAGTSGALSLRNLTSNTDDLIATYARGTTEQTHTATVKDPSDYVDSTTGQLLMTHKHVALIVFSSNGFDSFVDEIEVALPPE